MFTEMTATSTAQQLVSSFSEVVPPLWTAAVDVATRRGVAQAEAVPNVGHPRCIASATPRLKRRPRFSWLALGMRRVGPFVASFLVSFGLFRSLPLGRPRRQLNDSRLDTAQSVQHFNESAHESCAARDMRS